MWPAQHQILAGQDVGCRTINTTPVSLPALFRLELLPALGGDKTVELFRMEIEEMMFRVTSTDPTHTRLSLRCLD